MTDEAFRGAISPLAMLLAGHLTRDLFGKCIGWREFEFVFNELNARDEETELAVQVQLLQAGVLTVNEVRAMRGLGPIETGSGGASWRAMAAAAAGEAATTSRTMSAGIRWSGERMRLEAMAVKIPHVDGHPNRVPFEGVLTMVNAASDKAPAGARGHRVMLTREAAEKALPSLLGMAVDYRPGWDGHDARRKIGLLTEADLVGQRLVVRGYLYARDFPEVAAAIEASAAATRMRWA